MGKKAVIPAITGRSWIYGFNNLILDPTDPFQEGFTVGGYLGVISSLSTTNCQQSKQLLH